ncbi:aspartic peptidase domain-containing protein [Biscogniauxia mediterranea]|nr:aspartic peptidase domain-containing protein [Biscogniauxia mediterranea]
MLRNRLAVIIGTLLVPVSVYADEPSALWLAPSHEWYGIDGNWSSTGLLVGDPAQGIDVTVSTSLSEIWVVETTGCGTSSLCTTARGGTYDTSASQSWSPLGPWQLGLGYLDNGGNGDYAMETVAVQDSTRQGGQVSFGKQVVAGINDTSYYTGFLGLGITPGRFQNVVVQSPISTLVEHSGIIPSHSYGYTAGAYYGGSRGTPLSLTLGGYDANRFEPHDTKFSLDSITRQPSILLRAITASVSDVGKAPTAWASPSVPLMEFNESVTALIDSSTPYLWLPTTICDRFAASLNLTWDESFGLYVFSNTENLENYQSSPDLSFTFTLSSADNHDNFGQPLDVPGIVNITISSQAFVQNLRYPFKNLIPYRSPAVPYFPLTRADNSSQIIIGRSFLQEAYMITNYETSTFSIHQAKFPDDPWTNTSIQTIAFTPNSGYAGPGSKSGKQAGLTDAQLAGLVVGIAVIGIAAVAAIWLMRRRKRGHQEVAKSDHELKDGYSTPEPETPRSPVDRILSRMSMSMNMPWRRTKRGATGDGHDEYGVFEVGADWSHERYEMPVQTKPIELEATQTTLSSSIGITDFANKREREPQPPHRRSTYEMEKLHLEMAIHGLAPQYTPLADEPGKPYHQHHHHNTGATWHPGENHHQHHHPSPTTSSPTQQGEEEEEEEDTYSNRLLLPSPVSPQSDDWTNFVPTDFPSSVGLVPTRTLSSSSNSDPHMQQRRPRSRSSGTLPPSPRSIDRLTRSASSSSSTAGSIRTPPRGRGRGGVGGIGIQRTPIDPSRVVCLGPLPDNMRPPRPQWPAMFPPPPPPPVSSSSSPRHHHHHRRADEDEDEDEDEGEGEFAAAPADHHRHSRCLSTADTLGSDFTIEEEARQQAARTLGRMGGFDDIVHVPQPAHRRYSWEEEDEHEQGGRGGSRR